MRKVYNGPRRTITCLLRQLWSVRHALLMPDSLWGRAKMRRHLYAPSRHSL